MLEGPSAGRVFRLGNRGLIAKDFAESRTNELRRGCLRAQGWERTEVPETSPVGFEEDDDRLPDAFPDAPARHPPEWVTPVRFWEAPCPAPSALVSVRRLTREILRT
jgi:hypothetical protein